MEQEESQKPFSAKQARVRKAIREVRAATRRKFSAEEKIRIVLEGLRGDETISELCRREGIPDCVLQVVQEPPGGGEAETDWRDEAQRHERGGPGAEARE
jgi:hypothetical protein